MAVNVGKLDIRIVECRGLANLEMLGTSDPYAVVTCEGKKVKTGVKKNSLNPYWNEKFTFNIKDPNNAILTIKIMDANFLTDDEMGNCNIIVKDLVREKVDDRWIILKGCKKGEVHVRIMPTGFGKPPKPDATDAKIPPAAPTHQTTPPSKPVSQPPVAAAPPTQQPPQNAYPQQQQQQPGGYPQQQQQQQQNNGYPPQQQNNGGYPPQNQQPQQNNAYPPQNTGYPQQQAPASNNYPPQQQQGGYPPQQPAYGQQQQQPQYGGYPAAQNNAPGYNPYQPSAAQAPNPYTNTQPPAPVGGGNPYVQQVQQAQPYGAAAPQAYGQQPYYGNGV